MDGERFDTLTRRLARGTTRRAALRGLLATAAGLLGLGADDALGQQCRAAGRLCTKDANCCSGRCDTANPDPAKRNRCLCPPGQELCNGACKAPADFQGDVLNCGGCGRRCPDDPCNRATCTDGVCGLAPDPTRNGRACDDGNACTTGDVCQNGACVGTPVACATPGVCETAPGTCDPQTGTCAYPDAQDNTGCGTGQVCCAGTCCAAGETCANGTCQPGTCLGLDEFCDPTDNRCCQDQPTFCEETNCLGTGFVCCHRTGDFCGDSCDCCRFHLCRSNRCCRLPDDSCDADDQCCSGVCCGGVCCNDFQACCNGVCQAEGEECLALVPMGGSCTATSDCVTGSGLVCADGGVDDAVVCGDVCCTTSLGASCAPIADGSDCRCCGSVGCGCPESGTGTCGICGGLLAACATDGDCLSGRCAPSGGSGPNCCHALGGLCRPGLHSSCCGTVGCGSNTVCGGPGAPCSGNGECVSATCTSGSCA